MANRRHRPRSASVPAALSAAPESISEETPRATRRRSTRKTAAPGDAGLATPNTAVIDADAATATPIGTAEKKKTSKRKSSVVDSEKKRASAKNTKAAYEAAESDSSAAATAPASEKKQRSSRKQAAPGLKRRLSRKSTTPTPAAAAAGPNPASATPESTTKQKKSKRTTTPQRKNSAKPGKKTPARATPESGAKKPPVNKATPDTSSKKKSADAGASGSRRRSKRNSTAPFALSAAKSPPKDTAGDDQVTYTEPLELADGVATPKKDGDHKYNVTPLKRVLVDKDVEVPHGKRLKRTVRTEVRQVPVPEATMKLHELAVSNWRNGRLYKDADRKLPRPERLTEISRELTSSLHYRHVASLSEPAAARVFAAVSNAMATAPSAPVPRKNPENVTLAARCAALRARVLEQRVVLRQWAAAELACAEMERNPVTLPAVATETLKDFDKKGQNDARKAMEQTLLQCAAADVKLTKLDRAASNNDTRIKAAVDVFNEYVQRTSRLPKTPRKPSAFPRGGEVVAETPRGEPGAAAF